MKSGRTNDEVKAAPAATWSSSAIWAAPTPDELAALDALGKSGKWQLGEHTVSLTNLDKVLFPAKKPHRALDQARPHPPLRRASRPRCSPTSTAAR